jgi:hypothetical protein
MPNCPPGTPPWPTHPIWPPENPCQCGGDPNRCTCGCHGGGSPGQCQSDIFQCWSQVEMLKKIVADIIGEIGGPIKTGPIQGVTDGSNAQPGEVGEYYQNIMNVNFNSGTQTQNVAAGVLPPGDWDAYAMFIADLALSTAAFYLVPQPAGVSHNMGGVWNVGSPTVAQITANASPARANLVVPTLFNFSLETVAPSAYVGQFYFGARRRR